MIYQPRFRKKVHSALVANKVKASTAKRITEELAEKYFEQRVAYYSRDFTLYEPTLRFAALCKDLATGTAQFSEAINPAILVLGALHWIQYVDYNYGVGVSLNPDRHVERTSDVGVKEVSGPGFGPQMDPDMSLSQAAICLALALPTTPFAASTEEEHVNALRDSILLIPDLGDVAIADVDEIKETVAQLNRIGGLISRDGWFVHRPEISFQVPDED